MYLSSAGTPRNGFSNQTQLARKESREKNPTKIPCCEGGWTTASFIFCRILSQGSMRECFFSAPYYNGSFTLSNKNGSINNNNS